MYIIIEGDVNFMKKAIGLAISIALMFCVSNIAYAKTTYNVTRFAGLDRYKTSLKISNNFQQGGSYLSTYKNNLATLKDEVSNLSIPEGLETLNKQYLDSLDITNENSGIDSLYTRLTASLNNLGIENK